MDTLYPILYDRMSIAELDAIATENKKALDIMIGRFGQLPKQDTPVQIYRDKVLQYRTLVQAINKRTAHAPMYPDPYERVILDFYLDPSNLDKFAP